MSCHPNFTLSILAALCLAVVGCGKKSPNGQTIQGGRTTSDKLSISNANLYSYDQQPGVLFGTVKPTGGTEQFSYVVIFKKSNPSCAAECSLTGKGGSATCKLSEGGRSIQIDHEIELDDAGKIDKEQLKIDGKPVDIAAGRLFLIDLTPGDATPQQKNADQLKPIEALATTDDVNQVAKRIIESLKSEIPRDFAH